MRLVELDSAMPISCPGIKMSALSAPVDGNHPTHIFCRISDSLAVSGKAIRHDTCEDLFPEFELMFHYFTLRIIQNNTIPFSDQQTKIPMPNL
jgi:hypothetical protein